MRYFSFSVASPFLERPLTRRNDFIIYRAFEDAGNFMTAIFVVSGLAVPAILAHIKVIQIGALLMCISGGVVVYGTILVRNYLNNT